MKAGSKYERFVFEKLQRLFPDASVRLNDKIPGRVSGLVREIDVSVRIPLGDAEFLYIVQCKDWASRVDINTVGAFSAVMHDVGAAKGFLLCTSGFHKSNYQYAVARGIELVTIEDIESDKWDVEIQIPLVYVRKALNYMMTIEISANEALVELNRDRELTLDLTAKSLMRTGEGAPATSIEAHILSRVNGLAAPVKEGIEADLTQPNLELLLLNIWVPCTYLSVVLGSVKTHYLKYLTPTYLFS